MTKSFQGHSPAEAADCGHAKFVQKVTLKTGMPVNRAGAKVMEETGPKAEQLSQPAGKAKGNSYQVCIVDHEQGPVKV